MPAASPENPIHSPPVKNEGGILNINKPAGLTSFAVVQQIRRILNERKVGHCGTLDPMATGVLVVLFGNAVSRQDEYMTREKVYRAGMRLGIKTDTGDITGNVVQSSLPPVLSDAAVRTALEKFTGEIEQLPPMYSAVKFKGRRLYQYAREGKEIARPPRKVNILSIDLLSIKHPVIDFRVVCSKGTYIRTLVEDIGSCLNVPATLESLERERSGGFSIDDSLGWETLVRMSREDLISRSVVYGDLLGREKSQ